MKSLAATLCMLVALGCGYVFLANFEHPGVTWGKVVFGSLTACLLVGAVTIAAKKKGRE